MKIAGQTLERTAPARRATHIKKKKSKRKIIVWIIISAAAAALAALSVPFTRYQNNAMQTTVYTYGAGNKTSLCIAQVSDLHEKDFGDALNGAIKAQSPDIIVITGDLINSNSNTDLSFIKSVLGGFSSIAPTYFISGNHEAYGFNYDELKNIMDECGCVYLDDKAEVIEYNGVKFNLIGLKDPLMNPELADSGCKVKTEAASLELYKTTVSLLRGDMINILLSHRPEYFDTYIKTGVDLVLCGHAHGGQWRFFNQPVYAPGQGLFPKYAQGIQDCESTTMVVSRGLGPSSFPFRLFNRPELVIVNVNAE